MTHALYIKNLQKTYSDGFTALKGIDLSVEQGDFFALLGPNGAGKSTAIGIITSLVRKTAGEVSVFGYNIDTHLREAKSCLGVVPQEFNFHPYERVEDIIYNQAGFYGLTRAAAKSRVEYYLKKLDLWDKRSIQAIRLSGGMKRRLMIARAMVHEPKLLILDEPTAGVDLEIRLAMWDFIKDTNRDLGTTIILTTHYLEEAEQLCKNIAIINHGEVIEQTTMKSLLNQLDVETIVLDIQNKTNNNIGDNINDIDNNRSEVATLSAKGYNLRQIDANTLEVDIHKTQNMTALFIALDKQGITVKSMRNKANRLESLFLRLVKSEESEKKANKNDDSKDLV